MKKAEVWVKKRELLQQHKMNLLKQQLETVKMGNLEALMEANDA